MKKYLLPIGLFLAALFIVGATVHANPPFFLRYQTATATSTLGFLTPGTGTTTLVADLGISQASGADVATLLIQYTASGTAPILKFRQEFSNDNVDWYTEGLGSVPSIVTLNATTTQLVNTHEYAVSFATSTSGDFGGSGTGSRSLTSVQIPTPTRYTRVKFFVPASGGNGALYAEITAKKQSY